MLFFAFLFCHFVCHDLIFVTRQGREKDKFLCLGVVGFYKNKYYLITTKETGDKYPFVESVVPQLRVFDELLGG